MAQYYISSTKEYQKFDIVINLPPVEKKKPYKNSDEKWDYYRRFYFKTHFGRGSHRTFLKRSLERKNKEGYFQYRAYLLSELKQGFKVNLNNGSSQNRPFRKYVT